MAAAAKILPFAPLLDRGSLDSPLAVWSLVGRGMTFHRTPTGGGTDNRDYRWSSTPDADRCAVFGIRLGQRPSEPRDLADRLRPAAILQLPDTRRVAPGAYRGTGPPCLQNPVCSKRDGPQGAAAVRSDTRNLARASLVALSSIEGLFFDRSALLG